MSSKGEKIIRSLFLSIPAASIITISIITIMVFLMIQGQWSFSDVSNLYLRSPFILQAFINLIFLWILAFSGARLFSAKKPRTKSGNYSFSLLSLMLGVLLHPMVYGIAWFLPVTYSLFGPYHKAMVIFTAPTQIKMTLFENIIFHIFTPQVMLGILVSSIAFKRGLLNK